ncbi:MAG: hypothetical protein ACM3PC_02050 [Deltaproteobacteria bacterium]
MPSRSVVEDFIATIERGQFLEALDRFYAEDMTAYQVWRGDRIVSERYFYDPAQRQPRTGERH